MKIFISCGHNNARNLRSWFLKDQWASSGGNTEYQITRKICNEIQKKFKPEIGTEFVYVPEWLQLVDRVAWINNRAIDGDMCIELHLDSATPQAEGCTTYFMTGSKYAEDKARIFQQEYTRVTGIKGRWVKGDTTNRWGRLWFVRDTKVLAFLLEMGFITNNADKDKVWVKGAEALVSWLALITPLK